jgi:outer membrane protein assembly factor BamB
VRFIRRRHPFDHPAGPGADHEEILKEGIPMKRISVLLLSLAFLGTAGADWRQFRGTTPAGVANGESAPRKFGPKENLAWRIDLPGRGVSGPVVVGDRVFVTASGGQRQSRLHVLAFDARSGRKLWQRNFWATGPTASHPKTAMAAPTPASDGKHLVALFATNDLACFDLDGNLLWLRSLHGENPGASDGRGLASSPVISGSTVIVHDENQNVSFACSIDLETGADRWKVDRPRELCWTSPILVPGKKPDEELVLLQGSTRLTAIEPRTGRTAWTIERDSDPIASSALAGNVLLVPGGKGLAAFRLQPGKSPKRLWESLKLTPSSMASPVVLGDRVYSFRGSILVNGDLKTGRLRGKLRLAGAFSSSPLVAGGLLYCCNEAGTAFIIQPDEKDGTVLHRCELKDIILGTPALAGGALYVRSDKHLWKFAGPQKPGRKSKARGPLRPAGL